MKEQIYTIPISESFEQISGCPFCRLERELETDALQYVMGAAMMEPDVRIQTNKTGFCRTHYVAMSGMNNSLSLALMLETHLAQIDIDCLSKIGGRLSVKSAASQMSNVSRSCFVCSRVDKHLADYYANAAHVWKTEPDFRKLFRNQEFICLRHSSGLMETAVRVLSGKDLSLFGSAVHDLAHKLFTPVSQSIGRFIKSFDYRFAGTLTEEDSQSIPNAIKMLTGEKGSTKKK